MLCKELWVGRGETAMLCRELEQERQLCYVGSWKRGNSYAI
jgi:hypothetical protein